MGKGENAMIHNVLTLNNGIEIPQLGLVHGSFVMI